MTSHPGNDLFRVLSSYLIDSLADVRSQTGQGTLRFSASEFDAIGQLLFSSLENGGTCTLAVTGHIPWNPKRHYFEAARTAVRERGIKITRYFLLANRYFRHYPPLREHVKLDRDAGIATKIVYVGDLLKNLELGRSYSLDFGLWDRQVVGMAVNPALPFVQGPTDWLISKRPEYREFAEKLILVLEGLPEVPTSEAVSFQTDGDLVNLDEPLFATARFADFLSSACCQGDYVSGHDPGSSCEWYHAAWQYLRLFNMVSTPSWHDQFYRETLGTLASEGVSKILISGTADYSMLAYVLGAYRRALSPPSIVVLDLCQTPLMLCKWLAKQARVDIDIVAQDLMRYSAPSSYDLIVTDAFLTRFPPTEKQQILRRWASLLSSGGRVVTTVRVQPFRSSGPVVATPDEIRQFAHRARERSFNSQDFLGIAPDYLYHKAKGYAEKISSFPFESEQSVESLFKESSFKAKVNTVELHKGEMSENTTYCRVVAEKV